MPFDASGIYTTPSGSQNAAPGEVVQSAVWNNIFTDLSSAVTTTYGKLLTVGLSVLGNPATGTSAVVQAITGTAGQALVVNSGGTALGFVALSSAITGSGLSVIGVTGASPGNTGSIVGGAGQILAVNSGATALGFSSPLTIGLVTLADKNQPLSAGFRVTPLNVGTAGASLTINYGSGTMQRFITNAALTINAATTDGACDILVTNGASAGTITVSGFGGASTGDAYGTTSGNKFIFMSRTINGSSTYAWKAMQ